MTVEGGHVLDLGLEILVVRSWGTVIFLMCDPLAASERPAAGGEL